MTAKQWLLKPLPDKKLTDSITESLKIDTILATMLVQRGITNFDDAKNFFRPELSHLHDPFLMADMDKAVERLEMAFQREEKIMIYGDYDVDGTTAVALVYGFISTFYKNLEYYNPDRYLEGYGVSTQSIDWATENGVSLIIALDCGIKAQDKVQYAQEKGIDFIICDHHEPDETLPAAIAVLDPKRKDCQYPYKELTGNGVGFKLLQAYCLKKQISLEKLYDFLDLCVVSIASDIVPITGENRVLAFFGLKKLNENPRIGLKALREVAGFHNNQMSIENVVFILGPRINAAGRIKHAKAAVKLLLSEDYDEAISFAQEIHKHNTERKGHDSRMTEEALAMIENDSWLLKEAKSTVLFREDWHKGVIGIVASRCIEKYYRPTIIFTKTKDDYAAGSARSVAGFDLYAAIDECSHLLEQFGGHKHAAGMTLEIAKIDLFRAEFDKIVSKYITEEQLTPVISIDLKIRLADISPKFYRIISQMAPFGPSNMQPVFMTESLTLKYSPKIMKEKHLKLDLVEEETGAVFTAVGFGMAEEHLPKLSTHKYFKVAYQIDENSFAGRTSLQLMLRDIKY